jgi:hypothetical protein
MASDWDKLTQEWQGHEVGLVAEVDCTDHKKGGKKLCEYFGVESFPTIKYGEPNDLWDYDGGRSFTELNDFAKENLVPMCSVENFDICDPDTKLLLKKYVEMEESELKKLITAEEQKLRKAEAEYKAEVDKLTAQYEAAEQKRKNAIDQVSEGPLGVMRQVMVARLDAKEEEKTANDSAKEEL